MQPQHGSCAQNTYRKTATAVKGPIMQATPISFRMASDGTSDLESVIVWKGHGTSIMSYSIICMVIEVGINELMKENIITKQQENER